MDDQQTKNCFGKNDTTQLFLMHSILLGRIIPHYSICWECWLDTCYQRCGIWASLELKPIENMRLPEVQKSAVNSDLK